MSVKLTTIKRHKYITWHLPSENYEAKEADAKILMARGLSRIADATVKEAVKMHSADSYDTKDQKSEKDSSRTKKPRRSYKRRDMKAEE